METDPRIIANGYLDRDGYRIYWEDWGNSSSEPIFFLHGGPGSGFSDEHKSLFDPKIHRVIFHDQRGSRRSIPLGRIEINTTQYLIDDIEALRLHLGIEKISLAGGSWGSTLALLYAIAYPQQVQQMIIWSLFLARQSEIDFTNEGHPRYFFPQEWKRFISFVPEEFRTKGDDVMRYYFEKIQSPDKATASMYADEWMLWDAALCSMQYDPIIFEQDIIGDERNLPAATIQLHYLLNKSFIAENYILHNIQKIKDIPCTAVQGRFDMCTPPISAFDLKERYGDRLSLTIVNSSHDFTEPGMFQVLKGKLASVIG